MTPTNENIQTISHTAIRLGSMVYYDTGSGSARDALANGKKVQTIMNEMKGSALPVLVRGEMKVNERTATLKELGFHALASKTEEMASQAMMENMIALSPNGYKRITMAKFRAARNEIRSNTRAESVLVCTKIEEYMGQHISTGGDALMTGDEQTSFPPAEALSKLAAAKKEGIFDSYSVLHVVRGPDPILVGHIKGSEDMFMVCEWGNDISFDEIMK